MSKEVVIVSAVRTPIGRRGGGLAGMHSVDLLASVQRECVERAGVDPGTIGQVIGGCVSSVGEQAVNITRTAWIATGFPMEIGATTVDAQCGSSQQAVNLGAAMIAAGTLDSVMACGVESMSRVPLGSNMRGPGKRITESYLKHYEDTSQFQGAELIARRWGIDRADADQLGLRSQQLASEAWANGWFDAEVVPVKAPTLVDLPKTDPLHRKFAEREGTGEFHEVAKDEGLRSTTADALGSLQPVMKDGIHTAGSASQISDGAAAVLLMSAERAAAEGLTVLARVTGQCLVGSDPELMLTGPIEATKKVLKSRGGTMHDFDTVEINEAFASVVLAWRREFELDDQAFAKVNPAGGAIALGHPVGSTGARLVTTAVHTLRRRGGGLGLITMCCGGGLGTGTVIEVG